MIRGLCDYYRHAVAKRAFYGLRNEDYLRRKILTCMLPAL
ncbi:MAG: hypothetical protein ACRECE_04770 [Xanthobacteraceae bacterium]